MKEILTDQLIECLKDQKEVFGDTLFSKIDIPEITITETEVMPEIEIEKKEVSKIEKTVKEDFVESTSLEELNKKICNCQKCDLGKTRNKFVFGVGNPNADLMLVGEAPGADEDAQGIPFVGRAGKLLTDILKAINFEREDVYIANILKCRPPNNRDPLPSERKACQPYLMKQIELIKPKIILCLGKVAANALLDNKESLTKMRGDVHDFSGVRMMVTYHPAALLRNPNWKRGCWEDVQKVRKLYDELTK